MRKGRIVEKFTWTTSVPLSDDNELCRTTRTRDVRLWRERGCNRVCRDENYVCIIFNFPNILWRSQRRSSTPFKDSRGYEKLTIVGLRFSSDRWADRRIGASGKSTWLAWERYLFSLLVDPAHYFYRTRTIRHIFPRERDAGETSIYIHEILPTLVSIEILLRLLRIFHEYSRKISERHVEEFTLKRY